MASGIILLLYQLTSAGMAGAEDLLPDPGRWQPVVTTSEGQVYRSDLEMSSVPMIMITTTFNADAARVQAVVTDYDHFAEFIPNVMESRTLLHEGNAQWVFHHLHFPGPIADRMYVIKSTGASGSGEYDYRIDWQLAERQFPGIDRTAGIWPRVFSGFWELRSAVVDADLTEARYAVHSDPGGMIPDWLVETMTVRYVQQVTAAIRERLRSR